MDKGEFEAGPVEAKPAVVYKRKSNPALAIMAVIFALATIGLGIWVAILLTNKPKEETKASSNGTSQQASGASEIEPEEIAKDARIGYVLEESCSTGYLTKGGDFYVELTGACNNYPGNNTKYSVAAVDSATGQSGTFAVSLGAGKDIAEYEMFPETPASFAVKGIKVNSANVVAAATARYGQNLAGDVYVLVKNDGTIDVLFLDIMPNDTLKPTLVKNFGEFKNIASAIVVNNGVYISTVLITRNGGQISMTDALSKHFEAQN